MAKPRFIASLAFLAVIVSCLAACHGAVVTCGSTIKLQHISTGFRLHSHEVAYSRGSQQQSVTTFPTGDDGNSLWSVQSYPPCIPGSVIVKGQFVRLQHSATRKWLHSHLHKSPLSGKQEVSAFGGDDSGDGGDLWAIDWDSKHKEWTQDTKIRLKHRDTGAYLYSHEAKYGSPIAGQQEACASKDRRDTKNLWQAAEGVYIPVMSEAVSGSDSSREEL